ncbi:Plasmid stabilization system protein ParE [Lachnospiraceae bacterium YSD2013]|nr:Plasmid stabilization system protein ParE [Lachnospiraceae bacterium YSD2013]
MGEYEIIITPDAEADLNELDDYITFELKAPETAVRYIEDIKSQITMLSKSPRRFKLMENEPWKSRGVRRMNAKNFAVFFYVYEEYSEVYVMNVIYQKRDIPKILAELYPDIDELR